MGYTTDATTFHALDKRSRKLIDVAKRYSNKPEAVKLYDNADPEANVFNVEWWHDEEIGERVMVMSTNVGKFAFSPKLNQVVAYD